MVDEGEAKQAAGEAAGRLGLGGHGFYYLVLGLLVGQIALDVGSGEEASANGAISAIAQQPFGQTLLVALAVAFAAYTVHRIRHLVAADDGFTRFTDGLRAVVYTSLAFMTVKSLLSGASSSGGSGGRSTEASITARVLDLPFGQVLVAMAGAFLLGVACRQAYKAYSGGLDETYAELGIDGHRLVRTLGTVGYAGRTVAYGLSGGFVVLAAVTRDAENSQGLDGALRDVAGTAIGSVLLWSVAVGFLSYGAFRLALARYRDVEPDGE